MRVVATARDVAVLLILLATGVLGLVGFFVVLFKLRWAVWVLALWAVAASSTAGLASVVWGGTGLASGLAAAGGAVVFTGLIVWAGARAVVAGRTQDTRA